jgi:polyribonucleotide nucleotidyltransferase
VLAIEGNRIKLSRKALIKEQKAKMAQANPGAAEPVESEGGVASEEFGTQPYIPARAPAKPRHEFDERQPNSNQSTILIEGGDDFDEEGGEEFDEENEPNFNRVEGAPVPVGQVAGSGPRPQGAGNPANTNNNRRRRRRRPGGGSGGSSGGGRGPGGSNA